MNIRARSYVIVGTFLVTALQYGCSGSGGSAKQNTLPCVVDVAGPITQAGMSCQVGGSWYSATNLGTVTLTAIPGGPVASVNFQVGGQGELSVASYTNTQPNAFGIGIVEDSTGNTYVMGVGSNQTLHGSYTMGLSSVTVSADTGSSKAYAVHGTMSMTLDGPAGAGTETLHATF